MLTSVMTDPTGYGRIIRASDGRVLRIVEQRDASPEELDVTEVCTSIYAFRRDLLGPALRNLNADNAQGEFYLTDVIAGLAGMGHRVGAVQAQPSETQGVNDRWQLALAERELRNRTNRRWLLNGVTMLDPRQTFIDVTVKLGRDITIYPGTILQGDTVVGDGTDIGPDTQLDSCVVGSGCVVTHTVGHDASIGDGAERRAVRPSARRRCRRCRCRHRLVLHCTRTTTDRRTAPGGATLMEKVTTKKLALYSGRTHPELAQEVAQHLAQPVGDANIVEFANGEIRPRFAESVRGSDVFIMQSHYGIDGHSVNDSIMEQLTMIDAAYRASAKRITAVCPFYGYARQDRKAEGREPITARLVADMFKAAGAKRMISIDLHSGSDPGLLRGPGRPSDRRPGARELHPRAGAGLHPSSSRPTRVASRSPSAWRSTSTTATPTSPSSTSGDRRARRTSSRPKRSSAT